MLDAILGYLDTLPLAWLYIAAAAVAAFENIFPPFPSDVVVAFTVFVSARLGGPFWVAALAITIGNVLGGMIMYYVGRRYGSLLLLQKLEHYVGKNAGERLQELHAHYGVGALFISRFLPGVRALVPPFAGAMKIPAIHVVIALTIASAIWYTLIAYIAFETGENWALIVDRIKQSATWIGIAAVVLVVIIALIWYMRRFLNKKPSHYDDHS
jgi:membrane protein DedA with SNARE-associated domain